MKKHLPLLFFVVLALLAQKAQAQAAGDYRSIAAGDWSSISTWQMFDGANWLPAVAAPNQLSGVITVRDSVIVTGNDSADQVVVSPTGVLNIQGTLYLFDGAGTDLQSNGRLIVSLGGTLDADNGNVTVVYSSAAEFDIEGAVKAAVTFNGTAMQTINGSYGSGYVGPPITLNNASNLTLTGDIGLSGVNFIAGKILALGYFVIGQYTGSDFTGQGPASFIDGNVVCIVYDSSRAYFNLPMGKGNEYLPLQFFVKVPPTANESGFTITIHDTAPPAFTLDTSLTRVSVVRYYNISNPGNTSIDTASLQLSYDAADGVNDPANLRIAKSDTTGGTNNWLNLGGIGTAAPNGSITSTVNFKSLGNFVLANAKGGTNTLPLHFISFTANPNKQSVLLNWRTASEVNTNYFDVERTDGGNNWVTVGSVTANRNSTTNAYAFTDATVSGATSYVYRIKEVDKDGSFYFSNDALVRLTGIGKMTVTSLYPNPAKDVVNYYVSAAQNDNITVTVTAADGKMISAQHATANQPSQVVINNLAKGTYIITFANESTGEKVVKKIVKM